MHNFGEWSTKCICNLHAEHMHIAHIQRVRVCVCVLNLSNVYVLVFETYLKITDELLRDVTSDGFT